MFAGRLPMSTTCLPGNTVGAEYIGNDVHYQVGFENTSATSAQNIIIKNVIDASKFNVNIFVPLYSNYHYYVQVTNGNVVEFIFENINLPPNEEGFVSSKSRLYLRFNRATLSRTAQMYFLDSTSKQSPRILLPHQLLL